MEISNPLTGLFGKSPIKPIQKHMLQAHECACELEPFFNAIVAEDWQAVTLSRGKISDMENTADDLKKSIRLQLPKSLFLPVARTDLLELLGMQDKIANCTKDITGLMLGRKMVLPPQMAQDMISFVQASIATSAQALKAIEELDELIETGFGGREIDFVETLITRLDELEHLTDIKQVAIRSTLFALETDLPPVDVMFLYKIIDGVGELADLAQKVGSRLQLLLAR
jgi:predicted phosphate transport protein (TIGR00153 family)